jgi:hypothetical protein
MRGLALVDDVAQDRAIWHVSFVPTVTDGKGPGKPALTGAWVVGKGDAIDSLLAARICLIGKELREALGDLRLQIAAQRQIITTGVDQWAVDHHKTLVRPRWAPLPVFGFAGPRASGAPAELHAILACAQWARALLSAWQVTELQRSQRPYLAEQSHCLAVRTYPPGWVERWSPESSHWLSVSSVAAA